MKRRHPLLSARGSRRGWLAFVALLAATPAAARQLTVEVSPATPTWGDVVTLSVAVTACSPLSLVVAPGQTSHRLDVELSDACGDASPIPLTQRIALGRLDLGNWTLVVRDLSGGGEVTHHFAVAGRFAAEVVRPAVVTDAEPLTLMVPDVGYCPGVSWSVTGNLIEVRRHEDCETLEGTPIETFEVEASLGTLPAGDYELRMVDLRYLDAGQPRIASLPLRVWDADGCVPGDARLCLQHGRFRVEATWRDFAGNEGNAHGLPLADSEQSGQLWFFAADNSELTVKVLSGCGVNDKWWVFVSPSSTVEYELTVTDTATGGRKTYHHAAGEVTGLTADTDAFPCS